MFEPVSDTTTEAISFTQSNVTEKQGQIGQARWWRAVYMKDDVLTLWMADPYRESIFHASSNVYSNSTVRTNILKDFSDVMAKYGDAKTVIDTAIVKNNNPAQANTGSGFGTTATSGLANAYTNPAVPATDAIWLASAYEVLNTANDRIGYDTYTAYTTFRAGLWRVNGFDRAFNQGGGHNFVHLRSAYIPAASTANPGYILEKGGIEGEFNCGHYSRSVDAKVSERPAIHINIAKIREYAYADIRAEVEIG